MGSAPNAAATAAVPHRSEQGSNPIIRCSLYNVGLYSNCNHDFIIFRIKICDNAPQGVAVTQSALNEHLGSAGGTLNNCSY